MKLTTERLKQLIKEEIEKIPESEEPKVSKRVQRTRDQMKSGAQAAFDVVTDEEDIRQIIQDTINSLGQKNVPQNRILKVMRNMVRDMSNPNKK